MPNHVTTVCTVTGGPDAVRAFRERHLVANAKESSGVDFDFCTVIPKPACVDLSQASSDAELGIIALLWGAFERNQYATTRHIASGARSALVGYGAVPERLTRSADLVAHLEKNNKGAMEAGRQALRCIAETGSADWYEWSIRHWGTKWGAYECSVRSHEDGELVFSFDSAWSFPEPIFRRLIEMHPELLFSVVSYDEGDNFAMVGSASSACGYQIKQVDATPELYERVYGEPKPSDEED